MLTAHEIALDLNNKQVTYLFKACGVARFAYNWGLSEWKRQYEDHKKDPSQPVPSEATLRRQLNSIKYEQFPWMLEVTKNAPQMAIMQLGQAFSNFFAGRANYPRFRKKGMHDRFTLTNDQVKIKNSSLWIPKLGWVRMREKLRYIGKILSVTISYTAGRWFASIALETAEPLKNTTQRQGAVGVDLGVSAMATLSTGEKIQGPKSYRSMLQRVKMLGRALSRKTIGSKNRAKAKTKLARLHARIANIRKDAIHQFTTGLIRRFDTICIENLNVRGMLQDHRLSRAIADIGFYEIARQLKYKAARYGNRLVIVDRFFPSSKRCHCCGITLEELSLSARTWRCPGCDLEHDRDINAAKNLAAYAASSAA